MNDQNVIITPWEPNIPQYLITADKLDIPMPYSSIELVPQRKILMEHPAKIPIFGTINPRVTTT